jgi:hypothetical protein
MPDKGVMLVRQEVPVHEVLTGRPVQSDRPVPQATLEMPVHQDQLDRQDLEVTQDRLAIQERVEMRDQLEPRDLVE